MIGNPEVQIGHIFGTDVVGIDLAKEKARQQKTDNQQTSPVTGNLTDRKTESKSG
jgi:hypothetical protein